jgi:hypothetical protein
MEITGDLPSEFACFSAFAPLVAQRSPTTEKRPVTFDSLSAPPAVAAATAPTPAPAAPMLQLDAQKIERFCGLMTQAGRPTQAARMHADPLYARDRLAIGYGSASAELSRLALELFRLYEAQRAWH